MSPRLGLRVWFGSPVDMEVRDPMWLGVAEVKVPRFALERRSEEESSPGAGRVGSLRLMFIATWERRRSEGKRSKRGEERLMLERRSVALIDAAAAREWVEGRGELLLSRRGMAMLIERGEFVGGRVFMSGGMPSSANVDVNSLGRERIGSLRDVVGYR